MCCYHNKEAAEKLLASKRWGKDGRRTFWKVVTGVRRPLYGAVDVVFEPGKVLSIPVKQRKKYKRRYPRGFHVHMIKADAKAMHDVAYDLTGLMSRLMIRVRCHRDHLMAASDSEAVFHTIEVVD